jgi:hypothetical protein
MDPHETTHRRHEQATLQTLDSHQASLSRRDHIRSTTLLLYHDSQEDLFPSPFLALRMNTKSTAQHVVASAMTDIQWE